MMEAGKYRRDRLCKTLALLGITTDYCSVRASSVRMVVRQYKW